MTLEIAGTRQPIRLCAARSGLPPVLIVQAGPGLPLLNEVTRFQQRLQLEQRFTVAYWEQRGCGNAAPQDAQSVSLATQIDDACTVVRWLAATTGQRVVVLAISLGATVALQAVAREASSVKAMVAVSIDTDIPASDNATSAFLQEAADQPAARKLKKLVEKLRAPPYITPAPLQLRARLLTDLGGIEHGKRFGALLRSLIFSLIRTYGVLGAVATLRNMNAIQQRLLPEIAHLNLFAYWPRLALPVHYVFGDKDPLIPASLVKKQSGVIAPGDSIVRVPNAGHMVHFDAPEVVRDRVIQASAA